MIISRFSLTISKIEDFFSDILMTRPLAVFSVVGFVFIVLRLYVPVQPLILLISAMSIILIRLFHADKITVFIVFFILISGLLGLLRTDNAVNKTDWLREALDGETVRVVGNVDTVPNGNGDNTSFFLTVDEIHSNYSIYKDDFKLYVYADGKTPLKYGDRITFNADLRYVKGWSAGLDNYYLSKGAPLIADNIVILKIEKATFPLNLLTNTRNAILEIGDKYFTGETAMLFKALAGGERSTFSNELTDNLATSGLSHVASVSGLHVSILSMALYNFLKRKNRMWATIASLSIAYIFTMVTGAEPSTMRSAIMFTLFILAKALIYENDSFTALSLAALILSLLNPYVVFDWGFILSFLSVLGILLFSQLIKKKLAFLPDFLTESISATISAQILTVPAVANMFGCIPLYSVFANILVAAIFSTTLILCIAFVIVSFIPGINILWAMVCTLFLDAIASVARFFSEMPFSSVEIARFTTPFIICYYIFILLFVFRGKISKWLIGFTVIGCSAFLIITTIFSLPWCKTYEITDNSRLITTNEINVLIANDDLDSINYYLKTWNKDVDIDIMIVDVNANGKERALKNLHRYEGIDCLYLPESEKYSDIRIYAEKIGLDVYYFTEHDRADLYKYGMALINKRSQK